MRNRSTYMRGVTLLAGIALLVGVLGTPVPAAAVTPGEVGEGIGKAICYIVTLGVCIPILPPYRTFGTHSPPEPMRCTPARFTGPATFLTQPIMTVKYQFHGSCSRADMPNDPALNYRLEGSWTPGETNPNTPNASESLEITGYEPLSAGSRAWRPHFHVLDGSLCPRTLALTRGWELPKPACFYTGRLARFGHRSAANNLPQIENCNPCE